MDEKKEYTCVDCGQLFTVERVLQFHREQKNCLQRRVAIPPSVAPSPISESRPIINDARPLQQPLSVQPPLPQQPPPLTELLSPVRESLADVPPVVKLDIPLDQLLAIVNQPLTAGLSPKENMLLALFKANHISGAAMIAHIKK